MSLLNDKLDKVVGRWGVSLMRELFPTMDDDTVVISTDKYIHRYAKNAKERTSELNEWHIERNGVNLRIRCAFIKEINTLVIYEPINSIS